MPADNELKTLQHSILPPIATDITSLLAAESYISALDPNSVSPRAEYAFDTIATAFCSSAELVIPVSGAVSGPEPFVRMWADNASSLTELELTEEFAATVGLRLALNFVSDAEREPVDLVNWLAFQMSSSQVDASLLRGVIGQEVIVSHITAEFLNKHKLPKLTSAFESLFGDGSLRRPPEYESVINDHFQCYFHFLISWAFSFYLRGLSYGLSISEQHPSAVYKPHWLRSPLISHLGRDGGDVEKCPKANLFPWGTIIRAVFDPINPLMSREVENVQNVLLAVRENSAKFQPQTNVTLDTSTTKENEPSDAEIQILDILSDSDVIPLYTKGASTKKLLRWLRFATRPDVIWGDLLPEVVRIPLSRIPDIVERSTTIRRWEMEHRLTFRRDSVWDEFEDPGIRKALRDWSSQVPKANAELR